MSGFAKKYSIVATSILLFVFSFSLRIYGIGRTDEMWDEIYHVVNGQIYLGALKNSDFLPTLWEIGSDHMPLAKYIYGLSMQFPKRFDSIANIDSEFPEGHEFTMPRVASVIMGSLTVVAVFLIGKIVYGYRAGVFSALILSLLPHVVGHNRIAGLETPVIFFISLFFLSLLYSCKYKKPLFLLLSGVFLGLGISTRIDLASFLIIFPISYLVAREMRGYTLYFIFGIIFSLITPIIIWPWLWIDLSNLLNVVSRIFNSGGNRLEYFMGHFINPPPFYYLVYLAVTTPPIILFLLVISLVLIAKIRDSATQKLSLIILIWFLLPFQASFSWYKQDGVRYIVALYPALSLICGAGLSLILEKLHTNRWKKTLFSSLIFSSLLITLAMYFPYYIDYYNFISGGPKRVYKDKFFEFGWWGEGSYEALEYINKNAKSGDIIGFYVAPHHTIPKVREDLTYFIGGVDYADYLLLNTYVEKYSADRTETLEIREGDNKYDLVYVSNVRGAPLAKVFKKKDL